MMRAGRLTPIVLAMLGVLAVAFLFSSAPALAKTHVFSGSFGSATSTPPDSEPLSHPNGVAVDQSTGDVYVVDTGNKRVEKFTSTGEYLPPSFNGSLAPGGPFKEPTAVAVDQSGGDVWVVDSGDNVVDEFTEAGVYVTGSQLTGPSASATHPEPFLDPDGVAVDPNSGDIYVADHSTEAQGPGLIDIFEPSGGTFKFKTQFEPEARPWSLAVDSNSNVYVAEARASQAQEFTAEGLSEVGKFESSSEREAPRAVAVDLSDDDVYIAANHPEPTEAEVNEGVINEEKGLVDAYEPSGKFVESFGAGSFGIGGVEHPLRGVAVDSSSHAVYVANTAGDVVDVFAQVEGPTAVSEEPPTEVTATSATLPGEVNPNGVPLTECLFEYGLTSGYGQPPALCSEPSAAEVGKETSFVKVKAKLIGLTPNETYHYQLYAANKSAAGKGGDETFNTLAVLPTVNDRPPSVSATRTAARLSGTVNPENSSTTYHFEYGTTTAYGSKTEEVSAGAGYGDVSVRPQTIVELQPETTYHYRLVATNNVGTQNGPDYTFTTVSRTLPLVSSGAASGVTQTSASISGAVDPQGIRTSYAFEVGTDTGYSGAKLYGEVGEGEGVEPITVGLQDLAPATTYHYRLTATNADGTSYGQDMTFTTPGFPSPILQPLTAPLIATPTIAFPTGSQENTGTTETKKLTRAQKLTKALKACKKNVRHVNRKKCEKEARRKYGAVKKRTRA